MEGRIVVITSHDELTAIDGDIIDNLSYGINIYILKTSHMVCESDKVMFTKYIHNNDTSSRVIFINDSMEHEFKMMENDYYTESRRTMYPCPSDPFDKFKWYCPICYKEFHNM